jgi:Ca2+:H+ antiporter
LGPTAQRVLDGARAEATRLGHDAIGAEHMMLSLLREGSAAATALSARGLEPAGVARRLETAGRARAPGSIEPLEYTSHAKRLIENATREARAQGSALSAEHLLSAALREPRGPLARMLAEAGKAPLPRAPNAGRAFPWRSVLLVAVPVSIVLARLHQPPVLVFVTACLAVLPLAGYMGEATEHLAHKTGPTIGGLLNATFGNAAELIIAIAALRAGLVDLVKASITGSILGNLLLILGLSLLAAGLGRVELKFNRTAAGMSAAMLALAVVGLVFPALFHATHAESAARAAELHMSEWVAAILIGTYACSLVFTLRTHKRLLAGEPHPVMAPVWGTGKAALVLGLATVGVAVESEILVHATEAVTTTLGLGQVFLGLVIIPIIGNAAEHASAVMVARKGQVDLALQIALGSSTQIALLVAPLLVFVGVALGLGMDLVFQPFEVMALGLSTVVVAILTLDGESHWFEGVQLLAVYGMIGVAAFFI